MNLITLVHGIKTLVRRLEFIDLASETFTARLSSSGLTGNRSLKLPDRNGTVAIEESTQPLSPVLSSIATLTTPGLLYRTESGAALAQTMGATGAQSVSASSKSEGRSAIGLDSWLSMPGATITLPLVLVPQNEREAIDADGGWRRLTYVSYSGLGGILNGYPGALGKTFEFSLILFGENQMINQDVDWESQPWWSPASNLYLGKMEYRVKKDWGNGYQDPTFMPAQRYVEHWGSAANGSTMAVLPVALPNPELNGYTDYWSLEIRGLQKYPDLRPFPKWSVYAAFLVGTVVQES